MRAWLVQGAAWLVAGVAFVFLIPALPFLMAADYLDGKAQNLRDYGGWKD